jgi:hypothetical protein
MESHDNLSEIPITSVLVGTFAEALKNLGDTDGKFPEFINIQGTGTTKATSRTYKFKTEHVRKYLEQLSEIIGQVLHDYLPHFDELGTTSKRTTENPSTNVKELYEAGPAALGEMSTGSNQKSNPESETNEDEDEAVTELEDEPSTGSNAGTETGLETDLETGSAANNSNATTTNMSGGARSGKRRSRKLSLKKRSKLGHTVCLN